MKYYLYLVDEHVTRTRRGARAQAQTQFPYTVQYRY